jgi:hypothetical protein
MNGSARLVEIFEMWLKQQDSQKASEGCETMKTSFMISSSVW